VFIIDDNADNADAAFVLSMVVSAYDRQAGVAKSGCACLQMALDFHSDIVFLDVGMPDLSDWHATCRSTLHRTRTQVA
jgi:CheY-like chemotaxis protein